MISRERLQKTLNHVEPDRVPIDLGGSIVSSITKNAYNHLREYLGLEAGKPEIIDIVQQLPRVEEDVLHKLYIDTFPLGPNAPSAWKLEIKEEGEYLCFTDEWGSKLRMPKSGGLYFDWFEYPIKDARLESLNKYKWPDPDDPVRYNGLKEKAKQLYKNTDYALVGSALSGGGIFEQATRMKAYEEFLIDLVLNEKFADHLMGKLTDFYIQEYSHFLDEVGEYLEVIVYWNDLSAQDAPLFSLDIYKKLIKQKEKVLFELIKKKTKAKIFYHCCGAAYDFIPDFIEIGVDILNPVQVSARGMDTLNLKKEFGSDIVFWGGGCDTQNILYFGKPKDVKEEVKRRINDLAPGGGFVFNTVHNIQDGTPPENIMAMYETVWEYGKY